MPGIDCACLQSYHKVRLKADTTGVGTAAGPVRNRRSGKLDCMHPMGRVLLPALAGIGVLSLGLSLAAQEPTFRSGSRVVPSYVTVVDANNRLVTDLTREDFEVFDNGRPQEITIFDNEVRPFTRCRSCSIRASA